MMIDADLLVLESARPAEFPSLDIKTKYRKVLNEVVDGTDIAPVPIATIGLPFAIPCAARWEYGRLSGTFTPPSHAAMPTGNIFGGYLAGLADQWAGLATYSVIPDKLQLLTVNISMDFKAPAVIAETRLQASVTALTERKAIVQVLAWQSEVLLFEASVVEVLVPWRVRTA